MKTKNLIAVLSAVIVFAVLMLLPAPAGMEVKTWNMVAVVALISILWITEAIHLSVTALLPIILLPLLGITPASKVTLSYANDAIYLFLGGFILALAVERSNVHKRFALYTVRMVGTTPSLVILGFMMAVFFISMWMSNTTTVLIVVPICFAIINQFPEAHRHKQLPFQKALLLGIAYAATIGGLSTLVGTPPNIICASIISKTTGIDVSFMQWMAFALPVSLVLLFLSWILLTRVLFRVNRVELPFTRDFIVSELATLGKMTPHEKRILIVFTSVACLWLFHGLIPIPALKDSITDTSIAIAGAVSLFLIPDGTKKGSMLITWEEAKKLPWGILILFGGGLALSDGFNNSGLTSYLAHEFELLKSLNLWLILLIAISFAVFLSEIMSNTACAALLVPIVLTVASVFGVSPLMLAIPVTLATSTAFMLPVGTPPNAIVYSYNVLTIKDMVRAGFMLDLISIGLLLVASALFLR